jgi:hypothetical protein
MRARLYDPRPKANPFIATLAAQEMMGGGRPKGAPNAKFGPATRQSARLQEARAAQPLPEAAAFEEEPDEEMPPPPPKKPKRTQQIVALPPKPLSADQEKARELQFGAQRSKVAAAAQKEVPRSSLDKLIKASARPGVLLSHMIGLVPPAVVTAVANGEDSRLVHPPSASSTWLDIGTVDTPGALFDWLTTEVFPQAGAENVENPGARTYTSGVSMLVAIAVRWMGDIPAALVVPFYARVMAILWHATIGSKSRYFATQTAAIRKLRTRARDLFGPDDPRTQDIETLTTMRKLVKQVRQVEAGVALQQKQSKQRSINYNVVHAVRENAYQSEDPWDNLVFILLSTGARPIEALTLSTFEKAVPTDANDPDNPEAVAPWFGEGSNMLAISGLAKKKDEFERSVRFAPFLRDMPATGPKPALQTGQLNAYVRNWRRVTGIRQVTPTGGTYSSDVLQGITRNAHKRLATAITKLFTAEAYSEHMSAKDLRALYGNIAYDRAHTSEDFLMNKNTYMGQILGHKPGGQVSVNYQGWRVIYPSKEYPPTLETKVDDAIAQVQELAEKTEKTERVVDEIKILQDQEPGVKIKINDNDFMTKRRRSANTNADVDKAIRELHSKGGVATTRLLKRLGFGSQTVQAAMKRAGY